MMIDKQRSCFSRKTLIESWVVVEILARPSFYTSRKWSVNIKSILYPARIASEWIRDSHPEKLAYARLTPECLTTFVIHS
jgi:hypothetical protein